MIAPVVATAPASHPAQGQMAKDLAVREPGITWPTGFEPERAQLFAHNATHIAASCETVWQHIVDVGAWADWYPNAWRVRLLGGARALGPGVRWRWSTFGLAIESRIDRFVPTRQLSWFGYAPDSAPAFYHAWTLAPEGDGCRVAMDSAPDRAAFPGGDMYRGTPEDYRDAAIGYLAYSGRFFVDEDARTVRHEMAVSLFPNWQGQQQVRIPELGGDTLVLATDSPSRFDGSLKTARITWRRAAANS